MKSVSICMDLLTKPSWSFWWQNLPFLLKNCCFWDPTQIFQPDEIQFQMCGCTYEIQPDEFSPRGWKSYFQPIEKIHQNFTSKIFIWLKKFNQMKFIRLTQRKYQLSESNFCPYEAIILSVSTQAGIKNFGFFLLQRYLLYFSFETRHRHRHHLQLLSPFQKLSHWEICFRPKLSSGSKRGRISKKKSGLK